MPNRTTLSPTTPPSQVTFTVERANRSLAFVEPVVRDIVSNYHRLLRLRAERQKAEPSDPALAASLEHCVDLLNHYYRELLEVGCVLKDWQTGLVDFPAMCDGRQVWLCWRLGEPAVNHWHELHAGAAGRQVIDDAFADAVRGHG